MREIKYQGWNGTELLPIVRVHFDSDGAIWWSPFYDQRRLYNAEQYPLRQYTGLHDKNGKEIYEGDIVIYHDPGGWYGKPKDIIESVEFAEGRFEPFYGCDVEGDTNTYPNECEVIGNIYSNPEFLEVNK